MTRCNSIPIVWLMRVPAHHALARLLHQPPPAAMPAPLTPSSALPAFRKSYESFGQSDERDSFPASNSRRVRRWKILLPKNPQQVGLRHLDCPRYFPALRVKSPRETVAQALMGDYRPEHLFTVKQSLDGYRYYQKLIAELDDEIARLMHTLPIATEHPAPIPKRTKRTAYRRMGNDPLFDLRSELYRIASVDLTDNPGSECHRHTSGPHRGRTRCQSIPQCLAAGRRTSRGSFLPSPKPTSWVRIVFAQRLTAYLTRYRHGISHRRSYGCLHRLQTPRQQDDVHGMPLGTVLF
jgi:hypothetical protein